MTLKVRDFPTIAANLVAQMVTLTQEITDYTEGAVARSILESFATELQRQDVAVFQGVREGIEVGTYKNFDFFRLPATFASGLLRYTRVITAGPYTIPVGHQTRVPGSTTKVYRTTAEAEFADGVASIDVSVACTTTGSTGNTPANSIVEIVDTLGIDLSVTNVEPILTGVDQESEDDRRARFRLFIQGISKGTRAALEFAARSVVLTDADGNVTERVTGAFVREPFKETPEGLLGHVEVYVDNGSGSSSSALLAQVEQVIQGYVDGLGAVQKGYVAAGVDFGVFAVAAAPLAVVCTVSVAPGFVVDDVLAAVEEAITSYLQGLQVFETAIHAELVAVAMNVDGVSDVEFAAPTDNVAILYSQRITPGVITVKSA